MSPKQGTRAACNLRPRTEGGGGLGVVARSGGAAW